MRRCEWTLALARIKTTFCRATTRQVLGRARRVADAPVYIRRFVRRWVFIRADVFPVAAASVSEVSNRDARWTALKTLAKIDDDDEVLCAALRAVDEILLTVTAARELHHVVRRVGVRDGTANTIHDDDWTRGVDPVEAFTGTIRVEAQTPRARCLSSTFRAIGRMTCEMRGGEDDKDDVEEDDARARRTPTRTPTIGRPVERRRRARSALRHREV